MPVVSFEGTAAGIDLTPITTALTGAVSLSTIIGVIASIVGCTVLFVIGWKMAKKLYTAFVSAVSGHVSL